MKVLEYIARRQLSYTISSYYPVSKKEICKELFMDDKTYRREIKKLKKERLIKRKWVLMDYKDAWTDSRLCIGWKLTNKALNLENVKRIEDELTRSFNMRMSGRFLW